MTDRKSPRRVTGGQEQTATATATAVSHGTPDEAEFYAAFDTLVLTVDLETGQPVIGPITDELTNSVATFLVELINNDAELARTVAERMNDARADDVPLAVPVAALVPALTDATKRGGLG